MITTTSHPQHEDYMNFLRTGGTDGTIFHAANDLGYYGESLTKAWDLIFSSTEGIMLLGKYKAGLLDGTIDCYGVPTNPATAALRHHVTGAIERGDAEPITELLADNFQPCDNRSLVAQIGRGNIAAISGLRVISRETGITLPVSCGYSVTVDLAANDTYTVRRVFKRGAKTWIKGERSNVYCDQVGEVAYQASCFRNVEF